MSIIKTCRLQVHSPELQNEHKICKIEINLVTLDSHLLRYIADCSQTYSRY